MKVVLIGNIVTFIGALVMVGIGFIKKRNNIIIAQCMQFSIMGIGNLILGGVTGFITNIVSIIRNLFCLKWPFTAPVKIAFILVQLLISLSFNKMGLIGWLPIISTSIFTWFLDTKNEVLLKSIIIITVAMWVIYDFSLMNISSGVFDIFTMISNAIGIVIIKRKKSTDVKEV